MAGKQVTNACPIGGDGDAESKSMDVNGENHCVTSIMPPYLYPHLESLHFGSG